MEALMELKNISDTLLRRAANHKPKRGSPDDVASFGEQVRQLRASLSLTQEAFCERFKIPISNLRNWEQESVKPDNAARLLIEMIKVDPEAVAELAKLARGTGGLTKRKEYQEA
jgi:DNA-binding transcriptional regulator YiaG